MKKALLLIASLSFLFGCGNSNNGGTSSRGSIDEPKYTIDESYSVKSNRLPDFRYHIVWTDPEDASNTKEWTIYPDIILFRVHDTTLYYTSFFYICNNYTIYILEQCI